MKSPAARVKETGLQERNLSMRLDQQAVLWPYTRETPLPSPGISARGDGTFPENVRQWISEPELAELVAECVEQVPIRPETCPVDWKVLLGVVTYGYATGTYSSENLAAAIGEAQCGFYLNHRDPAQAIRKFRRNNRPLIESALANVLQNVYRLQAAARSRWSCGTTFARDPDFHSEAAARVNCAVRLDSYELDF